MARGINKVILIGNLGNDPEVRQGQGITICKLSLATSENWKNKETGANEERTEWHRVAIFGKLGDIAAQYLKKGSKVYIEGRLRTNKWQDQQGQDRYTTEIVADEMQMLDSRAGAGDSSFKPTSPSAYTTSKPNQASGMQSSPPPSAAAFDDDIPF